MKLTIEINLDNAAFTPDDVHLSSEEIKHVLSRVWENIGGSEVAFNNITGQRVLMDSNGNIVGKYLVE